MAWIANLNNAAADAKVITTLNGPSCFMSGQFYVQYSGLLSALASSTTETSIFFNQASATANTKTVPTTGAVNLSSDPTGKAPAASLYLPGPGALGSSNQAMGSLTLGTVIDGRAVGTFGINGTPDVTAKLVLRNPDTGAVAYTLATSAVTTTTAGGVVLLPSFCVTATGTSGTICGAIGILAGGLAGTAAAGAVTSTTVDTTKSYIIDLTWTWGTSHSSNTVTFYYASMGLLG